MRNILLLLISFGLVTTFCFFGCSKAMDQAHFVNTQGKGGSTARFTIYGTYLYTVDGTTLTSYDISGGTPVLKDQQEIGFEIETIYPFDGMLFIGSTSVIHIFALDDPAKPLKLSEAISPTVMRRCDPVIAKGTVAYATLRSGTECGGIQSVLAVYNIEDPVHPVQVNTYGLSAPRGLDYKDTVLYVADAPGIHVFSIRDPYNPLYLDKFSTGNHVELITYGSELYAIRRDATDIFSIQNLSKPELLATIE